MHSSRSGALRGPTTRHADAARRGSTPSRATRSRTACGGRPEPVAELEDGPGRDPDPSGRGRGGVDGLARASRARGASRPRAAGHRARVLERALAERGRRSARASRSARSRRGRAAPSHASPTLWTRSCDERPTSTSSSAPIVSPGERERLERVHDLLVAAGPPPPEAAFRSPRPSCSHTGGVERFSRSPRRSPLPRSRSAQPWSTARAGATSTSPRR